MDSVLRSQIVKRLAAEEGFDCCGIALPGPIGRSDYIRDWLSSGKAGTMDYLAKHLEKRLDPRELLSGAQSIIVVGMSYRHPEDASANVDQKAHEAGATGRVAMYARGEDYHVVMRAKLEALVQRMRVVLGDGHSSLPCGAGTKGLEARICVDTAPVVEREWAARAGIGWIGKNTLVMNREQGSYFFLGVCITSLELQADAPMEDHCGTCRACLDACPTAAFNAPYQMNASRCISYLTIEHRGDISKPFQEMMGDWIFGCDVCQEVCPFNRKTPPTREERFISKPSLERIAVHEAQHWENSEYADKLRGTPMRRAKLEMWKRNATIVANNMSKKKGEPISPP